MFPCMYEKFYSGKFNIVSEQGLLMASLGVEEYADVHPDEIEIQYTLDQLDDELKKLCQYLTAKHGKDIDLYEHPDVQTYMQAAHALRVVVSSIPKSCGGTSIMNPNNPERIYGDDYNFTFADGEVQLSILASDWRLDEDINTLERETFNVNDLTIRIKDLPAALKEKFGEQTITHQHPDIEFLKEARTALIKKIAEVDTTQFLHRALHQATEAQIGRASRLSPNTPPRSLFDIVAEPALPLPQRG